MRKCRHIGKRRVCSEARRRMPIVAQILAGKIRSFCGTPLLRVGDEKPLRRRVAIRALVGWVIPQISSHSGMGMINPAMVTEILAGSLVPSR